MNMIEEIKLKTELSKKSNKILEKIIENNKDDFDCVVFACTEFSMINLEELSGVPIIDSTNEYAKEVIRYAKNITLD